MLCEFCVTMTSNKNLDVSMDNLEGDEELGDVFTERDGLGNGHKGTVKGTNGESDPAGKELVVGDINTNNHQHKPMPTKKKHRRGSKRNKRRKYKPYPQLTWEEKKAVEERDSRRAVSIREKYMHEKGRPLAPFNTSQFLMAEHDTKEPDLHVSHHHHHEPHSRPMRLSSSADDSNDGFLSSSDEEQDIEDVRQFLEKDFTETYDRLHSESLHRMNKNELVNEYMQLEDKVENLEKELTDIKSNGKVCIGLCPPDVPEVVRHVNNTNFDEGNSRRKLELEVEKLREENRLLHIENGSLRPKEKVKEDPAI